MKVSKKLIYALCDPDGSVRYIGRSSSGLKRPRQHFGAADLKGSTYKENWIRSVLTTGSKPTIKVLHEFSDDATDAELNSSEVYFIQWYRTLGAKLTNATDGGEGTTGWIPSSATRLKISKSNTNPSPETLAKMSIAHKGHAVSPEHKAKISETLKGRVFSVEHCAKISEALKGKKLSPEHCAKISSDKTGKKHSAESRANMSKAQQSRGPNQFCRMGHPLTEENVYIYPNPTTSGRVQRQCILCKQIQSHAWYLRRRGTKQ